MPHFSMFYRYFIAVQGSDYLNRKKKKKYFHSYQQPGFSHVLALQPGSSFPRKLVGTLEIGLASVIQQLVIEKNLSHSLTQLRCRALMRSKHSRQE